MQLRDLFVFMVVAVATPLSLAVPFAGLLCFSWLAYMRPQDLCWGFARTMQFSFAVGMTMMLGWLFSDAGRRPFMRWDVRTKLMVALVLSTTVSLVMATNQDPYVQTRYVEYLKLVAVALFTTGQVDSRRRLKLLLWTIALSLGFFGIKGGFHGLMSGGSPILRGPGGMLEDNNDFALALTMSLPMLLYLGFLEKSRWVHRVCIVATGLTMLTILLTHSRGGFLSMCVVLGVFFWRSKQRWIALGVMLLLVVAFFQFAPQHVIDRIYSIGDSSDSSAHSRLTSWAIALRMIGAFPVWGVGLRNFQDHYHEFAQGLVPGSGFAFVAHNSYLQIWAEGGTVAFVLYIALLVACFWTLRRLRLASRRVPGADWIFNYSRMFEATMAGFVVGSVFLNRGHFDLIYHLFGIITAFQLIAWRWMAQPVGEREGDLVFADEFRPLVIAGSRLGQARDGPGLRSLPRWGR
ncbi:MAG: putative O-glycosylation ligase, exosortase A system-associated [Planctomycetota bacterium]